MAQIVQKPPLRGHVQTGGGFVQKQNRRFAQQRPGDGQALGLTLGNAPSPSAQTVVNPVGKLADKVPCTGDLQRLFQLAVSGVGTDQPEIFRNGAGEHAVALRNVGEYASGPGGDGVAVSAAAHPGGNALQNKASQQHDGHNGRGAPQHIRAVARDRVDEIFGGHAGNKTHNRAGQAQQPYGEDLSLIAPDLRLQPL